MSKGLIDRFFDDFKKIEGLEKQIRTLLKEREAALKAG